MVRKNDVRIYDRYGLWGYKFPRNSEFDDYFYDNNGEQNSESLHFADRIIHSR